VWWARSTSRAQATAAAFFVLITVLAGLSVYVWVSLSGTPLRKAVAEAAGAITPFAAQNAQLRRDLSKATSVIASQKGKLSAIQTEKLAPAIRPRPPSPAALAGPPSRRTPARSS
jgi:hypothetical protein